MITSSIEINRKPEDVFAYVDQLERHGEWQPAIVSARKEPAGPTRVGTRNIETRRVPGGPQEFVLGNCGARPAKAPGVPGTEWPRAAARNRDGRADRGWFAFAQYAGT